MQRILKLVLIFLSLIIFPILLDKGIGLIKCYASGFNLNAPKFIEEYYKLLGTLIIVLCGAYYAEKLINFRIKLEKTKEINKFRGQFLLLIKKIEELKYSNFEDDPLPQNSSLESVDKLIERINSSFENMPNVTLSISSYGLEKLFELIKHRKTLVFESGEFVFNETAISSMISCANELSKEGCYEID